MTNSERQVVRKVAISMVTRYNNQFRGVPDDIEMIAASDYDALLSKVEALRQYAQHKPYCKAIADFRADEPCSCGLASAKGEV